MRIPLHDELFCRLMIFTPRFQGDASGLYSPSMTTEIAPQDDRYVTEERRLVALLARLAKAQGLSVRAMELRAGVGKTVFAKVISGKVSPTVRHLLRMCDVLGLSWPQFYAFAHQQDDAPRGDEFEDRVLAIMARAGVLPSSHLR